MTIRLAKKLFILLLPIFILMSLTPADAQPVHIVTTDTSLYAFERMENELSLLKQRYLDVMDYFSFGRSHYGLPLYAVRVGAKDARHKVLITGNTHAREYMTTQLIMMQIESLCEGYDTESYSGIPYRRILGSTAIYFVPSLNPDGTRISQFGIFKVPQNKRDYVSQIPFVGEAGGFARWKANGAGVDLNQNYKGGWRKDRFIAAKNFGGYAPESEPEVRALMKLCKQNSFDVAINYHSSGEVIFWRQEGLDDAVSYLLATRISWATTYLMAEDNTSKGGFKGWFLSEFLRPCFTIEVGLGVSPLPLSQLNVIYRQNQYVPIICAWYVCTKY